jgi:asparagine synthase (glutamine-hydrolysing)
MCGIFGGVALTRPLRDESMRAMRDLMHRGPDGEGMVELEGAVLAHTRLRIIDLSCAADQPLWDARRQAVIVFNGEIYNYRELREECVAAGLDFLTSSDTEVIVNQFLLHGVEAFGRLNGMFAFCLYDARDGGAYLARDRFGIKPLYYAPTARGLLFSSELQPLLKSDGVDGTLDRAALQAYLQLDFVPTPHAIARGARKLDGGAYLKVARDGTWTASSYRLGHGKREAHLGGQQPAAHEQLLEELGKTIDAAVERHLISDVPVGIFLSGGIDSTIVAEAATRISGKPVATFSIAFENRSFDESEWSAAVAKAIGARHHVRTLRAEELLALVPEVSRRMDEPLADGSIYPTTLLAAFAREHVTVALSGDGADELFGGYPTYIAHGLVRRLPWPVRATLRKAGRLAHGLIPVSFDNLSRDYQLKKALDGLEDDLITRHMRWMGTFTPKELPDLLTDYDAGAQQELEMLLKEPAAAVTSAGWLEQLLRTDQRFYLQDGVLVKADRASMTSSLEVRVPFLDGELADLAGRLPAWAKVRGRTTKVLLRDYVARRFPPQIARRPKKGFGAPLGHWFRGPLRPLLEQVFAQARVAREGIFRPAFVTRMLDEHWRGRRDNRKQIFNLLSFALWYETFGHGT